MEIQLESQLEIIIKTQNEETSLWEQTCITKTQLIQQMRTKIARENEFGICC